MRSSGLVILAVLLLTSAASADSLMLRGSTIPLGGYEIQDIRSGRVYFKDIRGRRQYRELEEVAAIGFDGLTELDTAEALLAKGVSEDGLRSLLNSLLKAEEELPRLWVRIRLVRTHDARGEYVQAAGHAAAVFVMRDEPAWRHLEPICRPDRPGFSAAHETMQALRNAQRTVKDPELRIVIDRLIRTIQPIHDAVAVDYNGPPIEPESTVSGFPITAILSGRPGQPVPVTEAVGGADTGREIKPDPVSIPTKPAQPSLARPAETMVAPAAPTGDAPDAIDALLAAGRSREALSLCEHIADDPGSRRLSRFLYQYGRALRAEGRPDDAALMFMRSALLYEGSAPAAQCLIETATIYREVYANPGAARRLLERAIRLADVQGRHEDEQEARRLLADLPADSKR